MFAADRKASQLRGIAQSPVLGIAVAADVIVTVHQASLDVNLDGRPLVERLLHILRVGRVDDIVEGILCAVDYIESLHEFRAGLGVRDKLILHASREVESGVAWYIRVHEDVNLVAVVLGINARRIAHVRASARHHLVVPIVRIAICLVIVDAEVLLVSCPACVLDFQRNVSHVLRHADFGESGCQFIVAHRLIVGLQLRAGGVLEEVGAQRPCYVVGVLLLRISVLQAAINRAVTVPAGRFVISQSLGIDVNLGVRREEVSRRAGRRDGFHVGSLDVGTVEDALVQLSHLLADDDSLERATVGEGVAAKFQDAARDVDGLQSCPGEGVRLYRRDVLRQHHRLQP